MLTTLVPNDADLAEVLPSERLLANGMAIPEVRRALRRIPNWRNAKAVIIAWAWLCGLTWIGVHSPWWVGIGVFLAMGPLHVRFAILMHEAAHKLLFSNKRLNDVIGTWLIAFPAFVPIGLYRRSHFAHHREEFGPDEPDSAFYRGYPCAPRDLRRRLLRDAVGISGWKNFKVLLLSATKRRSARLAWSILGTQVALATLLWLVTGAWWAWVVFWWLPWMTQWRVLNRLRAIAEHGGMRASPDRRLTTHDVRQTWLARVWLVPYNTGWHLAHHVDMGVPWFHLPAYDRELRDAGYATDAIRFKNYTALWRAAITG
jgi:fatty acid desaturase